MKDKFSFNDFTRQVEILGRCLSGEKFSKADLAYEYGTSEITINRDLNALRNLGIQIYSQKGELIIYKFPPNETLVNLTSHYLPLKLNSRLINKQIKVLSNVKKKEFFHNLIIASKAVSESKILEFKYKRIKDNAIRNYRIKPVRLYHDEMNWILQGFKTESNFFRTFYITRIFEIKITDENFDKIVEPEISDEKYKMIFKFNSQVENQILDKIWFDNYTIDKDNEGFIYLTVNEYINNKLAGWCISWWDMIEIIEPYELKAHIRQMIEAFVSINFK